MYDDSIRDTDWKLFMVIECSIRCRVNCAPIPLKSRTYHDELPLHGQKKNFLNALLIISNFDQVPLCFARLVLTRPNYYYAITIIIKITL